MADKAKLPDFVSSADALRAPNDPTTDPYHTRGMDPATAEAGFRAAGLPEKGPLSDKKTPQSEVTKDVAIAEVHGPNPTADDVPPEGGIVREDAVVDDHAAAANK